MQRPSAPTFAHSPSRPLCVVCVFSPKFGDALDYYREFVRWTLGEAGSTAAAPPLPTLAAVRAGPLLDLPATTTDSDAAVSASASASSDGIDWDISVEGAGEASSSIDWDITTEASGEATSGDASGGIDWGDADSAGAASADGGINWDIETTGSGEAAAASSSAADASPPTASPAAAAARADSLESSDLRQLFLSELLELEAFLVERLSDQSGGSSTGAGVGSAGGADDLTAAAFSGTNVPHILTLQAAHHTQAYLVSRHAPARQTASIVPRPFVPSSLPSSASSFGLPFSFSLPCALSPALLGCCPRLSAGAPLSSSHAVAPDSHQPTVSPPLAALLRSFAHLALAVFDSSLRCLSCVLPLCFVSLFVCFALL